MLCSVLLILLNCVFWTRQTRSATATFSAANSGIDGWVTIDNRIVSVYLNLASLDYSKLPSVDCLVDGLKFHVHEKWTHSDYKDRIGSSECSSSYTGDHYDPTLACGPSTGNPYCLSYTGTNSSYKCVKSSSAFTTKNIYECNSTNYLLNPYVCEAGDLSGKYGELYLTRNITSGNFSSFWELMSDDVETKSIVFHCGSSDMRAFCAPFNYTNEEYDVYSTEYNITDDKMYVAAVFKNMGGNVLNESFIAFQQDGDYIGAFDFSGLNLNCSSISYRIYDQWDSTEASFVGNSNCSKVVGKVWDPTVTCLPNTDSPFCSSNCKLCNDSSYNYSCNFTENRYSCSPSDLSGKYGLLQLTNKIINNNNYSGMVFSMREVMERVFVINGTDDFAPPFDSLYNKSIVLECEDHTQKIACAQIVTNMTEVMKLYTNFTIPTSNYSTTTPPTNATVKPTGTSVSTTSGMATTMSATSMFTTPNFTITTPKVTITTTKSQASSNGVYYFAAFCVMISMLVLQF